MSFGTATTEFNIQHLTDLFSADKREEAQSYVLQYFIKLDNGKFIYKYSPNSKSLLHMDYDTCKSLYLKKSISKTITIKNKSITESFQSWFFEDHHDVYKQEFNPHKSLIWSENGTNYVNEFYGYKFTKRPATFSANALKGVKFIWDHVKDVLCSKQEESFKYFQQWVCSSLSKKMKVIPILKALQGTGKSAFTDFMKDVLGESNTATTSDLDEVFGSFNELMHNKIFVFFEELPCASTGEWMKVNQKIKQWITGDQLSMKAKFKKPLHVKNCLSAIICSNNDCVILEEDDRRFFMLVVSNHRQADTKYFNELFKYTKSNEVQEAFYWLGLDMADKDFNEALIPITKAKQDIIIDNMHNIFEFIKHRYVLKHKDINVRFKKFYENYLTYCENNKEKPVSAIKLSKKLSDYMIPIEARTGNIKFICMPENDLLALYKKRNWIHDLDEFEDKVNIDDSDDNKSTDDISNDAFVSTFNDNSTTREKELDDIILAFD
jgi:hypothetical protein